MTRNPIKNEYGKIIGFIEELDNGDKIAKDFYGRILGKYRKEQNNTRDFYGRIVGKGDVSSGLIWEDYLKKENERTKNKESKK